jgi:hypothetical protein
MSSAFTELRHLQRVGCEIDLEDWLVGGIHLAERRRACQSSGTATVEMMALSEPEIFASWALSREFTT